METTVQGSCLNGQNGKKRPIRNQAGPAPRTAACLLDSSNGNDGCQLPSHFGSPWHWMYLEID